MVIISSVAVNPANGARLGKGEGLSDDFCAEES